MSELAASVMLPMLCCAVIQAVYRQNAAALLRTFLVNLPIALLFTGVAVELVRMGMVITDAMSARFMAASGVDTRHLLAPVGVVLLSASAAAPGFAICLASMLVAGTAMVLWLELVVRAAAITAAALFLPLVLAALVWPAIGHWARRLADTLAALVLSKLVIAAVISLAVGAVEGGFSEQGSAGTKFGDVVVGIALLLLATFSPFVLLRLIPAVEAGAVSHLEGARHRLRQNVDSAGGKVLDSYLKRAGGGDKKQQQQQLPVGEAAKAAVPVSKGDGGWPTGAAVAEDEAKLAPVGKFWKDTHGAEGSAHGAEGSAHGPRGATHDAEGSTHGPRGSTHGPRGAIDASSTDSESAQPPARGRDG
ncbi:MAG TPA: hypothetical protein VMD59_09985 [Acidimicrobiales bacterium]|nr:hypothetical protein [Acidimicrobiales bacterium]